MEGERKKTTTWLFTVGETRLEIVEDDYHEAMKKAEEWRKSKNITVRPKSKGLKVEGVIDDRG